MSNVNAVETVAVMGIPISNVTMEEAIAFIDLSIQSGGFHQFATANVDFVKNAIDDPELQRILFRCDLVVPDGMPLLWISKMLNCPLRERVCGVDMVPRLAELAVGRGYRIFLLGASESVSRKAAANLKEQYPDLDICGRYSPPLAPLAEMDHDFILKRIKAARPDILLVAFGNPKQEKWIAMHRDKLDVAACIGIGGTLDFIAGELPRAPKWMRGAGLEWFYRCSQEPLRLTSRYVSDAAALAVHLPKQLVPHAMQAKCRTGSQVFAQSTDETMVISVHGELSGPILKDFVAIAESAITAGANIVVNMSRTMSLGIDALGELIRLYSQLSPIQSLFLAGMRPNQIRVLHGAKLDVPFRTVSSVNDGMNRAVRARQRRLRKPVVQLGYDEPHSTCVQFKAVMPLDVCRRLSLPPRPLPHDAFSLDTRAAVGS